MLMNFFDMTMPVTLAMDKGDMAVYAVLLAVALAAAAIYDFRKKLPRILFVRCFLISFVFGECMLLAGLFDWPKGVLSTFLILMIAAMFTGLGAAAHMFFNINAVGEKKKYFTNIAWFITIGLICLIIFSVWFIIWCITK